MSEYTHESFFDENPGEFIRDRRMHYLMVNAISRRVRQLQLGERALSTPPDGSRDTTRVAIQEFLDDHLEITPRVHLHHEEEQEPITEIG